MAASWIRLDTKILIVGWTSRLPAEQFAVWTKLLIAVKLFGMRGGRIQRCYFDDEQLTTWRMSRNAFEKVISLAQTNDALTIDDEGIITVTGWNRYQLDSTSSERKIRQREKDVTDVTSVTDVTTTETETETETGRRRKPPVVPRKKPEKPKGEFPEIPEYLKTIWPEWVQSRKENKPALTPLAVKQQLKKLSECSPKDAIEIVEYSIMNSYQGLIFDRRKDTHGRGTNKTRGLGNISQPPKEFDEPQADPGAAFH